jgi:hypothetical protein
LRKAVTNVASAPLITAYGAAPSTTSLNVVDAASDDVLSPAAAARHVLLASVCLGDSPRNSLHFPRQTATGSAPLTPTPARWA